METKTGLVKIQQNSCYWRTELAFSRTVLFWLFFFVRFMFWWTLPYQLTISRTFEVKFMDKHASDTFWNRREIHLSQNFSPVSKCKKTRREFMHCKQSLVCFWQVGSTYDLPNWLIDVLCGNRLQWVELIHQVVANHMWWFLRSLVETFDQSVCGIWDWHNCDSRWGCLMNYSGAAFWCLYYFVHQIIVNTSLLF